MDAGGDTAVDTEVVAEAAASPGADVGASAAGAGAGAGATSVIAVAEVELSGAAAPDTGDAEAGLDLVDFRSTNCTQSV